MTDQLNIGPEALWTVEDVMAYLTLSSDTMIYRLVSESAIPHIRLGKKLLRFDPTAIENWLLPNGFGYKPIKRFTGQPVLRVPDVALRLAVKHGVIYRMFRQGELPGRRVGGLWLTSTHWLDLWIHERVVYPEDETNFKSFREFGDTYFVLMRA